MKFFYEVTILFIIKKKGVEMTKEMVLEKVKAFPPLDDTVSKVIAVCNDENSSIKDLVNAIESDPMIVANILKAANSPLYGFSREIRGISQAVSIFGMETVKGFAFSSFLQKKLDLDLSPYGLSAKEFINITERQNAFMLQWFKNKRSMLDVLALTSFLMEVGKVVLSSILKEHKKVDEFKAYVDKLSNLEELKELEIQVFGTTNEEISAILFEEWNFDENMYEAIRNLHNPQNADEDIKVYSQALQVVKTLIPTQKFDIQTNIEHSLQLVKRYNLNPNRFNELLEELFQSV